MWSIAKHYFFRTIEKFCSIKNIIFLYETKVGLKNVNMGHVAQIGVPTILDHVVLDAESILMGPDFLTDEYTLIEKNINSSPHFTFMKAFNDNESIMSTEYVKRWKTGTLDWRRPMPIKLGVNEWYEKFEQRKRDILEDAYSNVLVYRAGGKYYIYDGKHRAALCAVLGKQIKCDVIPDSCVFAYYNGYMLDIVSKKKRYLKHKKFMDLRE